MRSKNPELMKSIQSFVNQYCLETSRTPSVSEIANALGISKGCAQNYLKEMDEKRMISYQDGELNIIIGGHCLQFCSELVAELEKRLDCVGMTWTLKTESSA